VELQVPTCVQSDVAESRHLSGLYDYSAGHMT